MSFIRTLMYNKFEIVLNDNSIGIARKEFFEKTLEEIGLDPSTSACDRLLAFYRARQDISVISVMHSIQSGFVTMKKNLNDTIVNDILHSRNLLVLRPVFLILFFNSSFKNLTCTSYQTKEYAIKVMRTVLITRS